jgi:hypothetical protein
MFIITIRAIFVLLCEYAYIVRYCHFSVRKSGKTNFSSGATSRVIHISSSNSFYDIFSSVDRSVLTMPQLNLTLGELLVRREAHLEKRAISWYAVRDALWDGNGYSGQDESCLKYLHLPENLDHVHFDLNRSHPDDNHQLKEYARTENISDLLCWIQEFGNQEDW